MSATEERYEPLLDDESDNAAQADSARAARHVKENVTSSAAFTWRSLRSCKCSTASPMVRISFPVRGPISWPPLLSSAVTIAAPSAFSRVVVASQFDPHRWRLGDDANDDDANE